MVNGDAAIAEGDVQPGEFVGDLWAVGAEFQPANNDVFDVVIV